MPYLGLLIAYLLGSVPAAYLAGRLKNLDLRAHGSGNLGATNAWRVMGWKVGLPVYLFDTAKGFVPAAMFAQWFHATGEWWAIAFGVAAIVGHVRPIFLGGKGGGKGVATAGGVFLGLAPGSLLFSFLVFVVVFLATGYVSLGSLISAVALSVAVFVTFGLTPVFFVSVFVTAFVFWTHRANIVRLRRGEESRFRPWRRRSSTPGEGAV